jgi:hypothetical protein
MIFLVNKFTSIVIPTYIFKMRYLQRFGIFYILVFSCWKTIMGDWKLDRKSLSKWREMQHYKYIMSKRHITGWPSPLIFLGTHYWYVIRIIYVKSTTYEVCVQKYACKACVYYTLPLKPPSRSLVHQVILISPATNIAALCSYYYYRVLSHIQYVYYIIRILGGLL